MGNAEFYEQVGVAMTCRSFQEYEDMFMLDEQLLQKGRILDVAAGGSSFVAELRKRRYDAAAVDPLYKLSAEEMNMFGNKEIDITTQKLDKIKHQLVWDSYKSLEYHNEIRIKSFQQFLEDYEKDGKKETYITAALPSLPFADETFSFVLCNHFLFLYQEQFDYEFHLRALNELLRITKKGGVIRIYPLVGFKNEPYPYLNQLIDTLEHQGVEIELTPTNFCFLPTATHFLHIKK